MSYIAPEIWEKFESLSGNLKNTILERNVRIQNIHDLINVLEDIVAEDCYSSYATIVLHEIFFFC